MAANASDLVSACLVGPVLNAASVMPYNLTLASGRVRPAMMSAGIGALVYGSVLALLAPKLGVFAGALGSALVSLVGLLVMARFAVLPLLPGQTSSWLSRDVIVPLATAACVAGLFRVVTPSSASQYGQLACILLASLATMSCTILVTPGARQEAATRFQTLRALIHPSRG
jgi:O-antigen/teichoic acid export membrane protein